MAMKRMNVEEYYSKKEELLKSGYVEVSALYGAKKSEVVSLDNKMLAKYNESEYSLVAMYYVGGMAFTYEAFAKRKDGNELYVEDCNEVEARKYYRAVCVPKSHTDYPERPRFYVFYADNKAMYDAKLAILTKCCEEDDVREIPFSTYKGAYNNERYF